MTFWGVDCDKRYGWVLAHGAAQAWSPTDDEGAGRCAYVEDVQGNVVGLMTPAQGETENAD